MTPSFTRNRISGYTALASLTLMLCTALWMQATHKPEQLRSTEERYDNPDALAEWQFKRLRDPKTGEIPYGIRSRELEFARRLNGRSSFVADATPQLEWEQRGPYNVGGRTRAIAIDLNDSHRLLAAAAMGGVWRSSDDGTTWERRTKLDDLHDVTCLAQDPRTGHRNVWYHGTGELLSTTERRTSHATAPRWRTTDLGGGIYRSSDGGESWSVLPSTVAGQSTKLDSVFDGVWNIEIDNSGSVYAACYGAVMRSDNEGASWKRVIGDLAHRSFMTEVHVGPSGAIYAALTTLTIDGSIPDSSGIYRSTDKGEHWQQVMAFAPVWGMRGVTFSIAPSDENSINVLAETLNAGASGHSFWHIEQRLPGLPLIDDLSDNIPFVAPGDVWNMNTLGSYSLVLKTAPIDPNTLYIGGTNLYRSQDGMHSQPEWIGGYAQQDGQYILHPDLHGLQFVSGSSVEAYAVCDGGVYHTPDLQAAEVTWIDKNAGYVTSMAYSVAMDHSQTDQLLICGLQDNGSVLQNDPSQPWFTLSGGDGTNCQIADGQQYIYTAAQLGNTIRSHFSSAGEFLGSSYIIPGGASDFLFLTPYILDPSDNSIYLTAAGPRLWVNTDITAIPDDLYDYSTINWTKLNKTETSDQSAITSLAMSASAPHHVWYGTESGRVFVLDDVRSATETPRELTSSLFPSDAYISSLAVDDSNTSNIIVVFSNYGVQSIFATSDAGSSWRDISGNLEAHPDGSGDGPSCRWITIGHYAGRTMYFVATSIGLYATTDISGLSVTWSQQGATSIGTHIVESIDTRAIDGMIAVATQGAGVFSAVIPAGPQSSVSLEHSGPAVDIIPNPARDRTTLSVRADRDENASVTLVDITGAVRFRRTMRVSRGTNSLLLDLTTVPQGAFVCEVRTRAGVTRKWLRIRR